MRNRIETVLDWLYKAWLVFALPFVIYDLWGKWWVWCIMLPLIVTVQLIGKYHYLRRFYFRFRLFRAAYFADTYVLITRPEDASEPMTIYHNYQDTKTVSALCGTVAVELHKADCSIDTLTNELGIKRSEE